MKKSFILGLAMLAITGSAIAQKGELNTAKQEYDKYTMMRGTALAKNTLATAKTSIDAASQHSKTSADPQTWAYKALIYADLATAAKDQDAPALISEAQAAMAKVKELDAAGTQAENVQKANNILVQYQFGKAKKFYDKKDYKNAYNEFNKGLEYAPGDTTLAFAAGISAMNSKDYTNGIARFNELLKTNYSGLPSVYENLAFMYLSQKDTTAAIKALSEGSAKFPNNSELATKEIQYSLIAGKEKEVISKISAQAEKNPTNKLFPFYLGIAYNTAKDYKKAEASYKRALEIDPNYEDAVVNLGVIIMNNGINMYNAANKIPENKVAEYNAAKKAALAEFDRSFPHLQKAAELNPKSEMALSNLKRYYVVTNKPDKAAEIEAKIKALGAQ